MSSVSHCPPATRMRTHAHGDVVELRAAGTPGRPSLLLVHGLEGSWTGWGRLVDQLQEDYHLLLASAGFALRRGVARFPRFT